jgi:hypothetical protein
MSRQVVSHNCLRSTVVVVDVEGCVVRGVEFVRAIVIQQGVHESAEVLYRPFLRHWVYLYICQTCSQNVNRNMINLTSGFGSYEIKSEMKGRGTYQVRLVDKIFEDVWDEVVAESIKLWKALLQECWQRFNPFVNDSLQRDYIILHIDHATP